MTMMPLYIGTSRDITPNSTTFDKLKALATLAPILAKMAHLGAGAMLEELKAKFNLRAKDLRGLEADIKQVRKAKARARRLHGPGIE